MHNTNSATSLSVIIPMRAGSKRVKNKNTRKFGPFEHGLAELKLRQIVHLRAVDEIILDTDEPAFEAVLADLANSGLDISKVRLETRDPEFATDTATTDALIRYLGSKIKTTHVLWTHVTSPFMDCLTDTESIAEYFRLDPEVNDSLMSVTGLKEFIWDRTGPRNYDYGKEKWPRTQTLPDWYFINSGIFICPSAFYKDRGNRIGETPFLFEVNKIRSFDVDWPEDFEIAESLMERRPNLAGLA